MFPPKISAGVKLIIHVNPTHSKNQNQCPYILNKIVKNIKKNANDPAISANVEKIFFYLITIRIIKWEIPAREKHATTVPCTVFL